MQDGNNNASRINRRTRYISVIVRLLLSNVQSRPRRMLAQAKRDIIFDEQVSSLFACMIC